MGLANLKKEIPHYEKYHLIYHGKALLKTLIFHQNVLQFPDVQDIPRKLKSLSIKFASKAASVALAARRKSKLTSITDEIKQSGGNAIGIKTDITKSIECKNLIDETLDQYGRIDLLLLGAGVSMWTPFEKISDISFFKDVMDTNYTGAVHCVHAALPHLISSKGMVVTCSTAQAIVGFTNHSGYAASKHALHGFLDTLDMELDGKVLFLEAFLGWIRGTSMRSNACLLYTSPSPRDS